MTKADLSIDKRSCEPSMLDSADPSAAQDSAAAAPSSEQVAARARWIHWLAVSVVCITWPLVWVGSLVTTYNAGMAVPDWPNTFGYNMWLYPWQTWLFGPFDLMIEHGHRLLGTLVGFVAILLVIAASLWESRTWVRRLCVLSLVAVILQGALGGARVLFDARMIAMIHACFAQAFFILSWVLAGVTARWWNAVAQIKADGGGEVSEGEKFEGSKFSNGLGRLMLAVPILSYIQLLLGAQLRHVPVGASAGFFKMTVVFHVLGAALLAILVLWAGGKLYRCGDLTLSRLGRCLIVLVVLQWSLGIGTWFVNYGWPWGFEHMPALSRFVIESNGYRESLIVCGHVAIGSLILGLSSFIWLRTLRLTYVSQRGATSH